MTDGRVIPLSRTIWINGVITDMNTLRKGLKAGVETTWVLGKVIFPVTMIVTDFILYTRYRLDRLALCPLDEMDRSVW